MTQLLMTQAPEFTAPSIVWWPLVPTIVVLLGAVVGVLIEAFVPKGARRPTNIVWTVLVLGAAFLLATIQWATAYESPSVIGEFVDDTLTASMQIIVTLIGFLSVLVMADRTAVGDGAFAGQPSDRPGSGEESLTIAKGYQRSEFFPLALFSIGGMMLFPASDSLLTMFVALEVMSLPLYVLAASARRRRELSQESAIKYFILGSFAAAFFLMGSALLYGYSGGSLRLGAIANAIPYANNMDWILLVGVVMVMAGLLFKVAVFPFQQWAPDVYTGAPTPVTGFMAAGVKVAAFGALLRFYVVVAGHLKWDFALLFGLLAAATIIFGTVGGLVQKNMKRLLAYSAIAHAGFLTIAVLSLTVGSAGAMAFYLLSYGVATVGAFAAITLVRRTDKQGNIGDEAQGISAWNGMGKRNPVLAVAMLIFLLSFAGIPLTSGFVAKFVVFAAGVQGGLGWLVGIALGASVATAVFYFRIVAAMFFKKPKDDVTVVQSEGLAVVVIGFAAIVTLLLGIIPGPVLSFLEATAIFVP